MGDMDELYRQVIEAIDLSDYKGRPVPVQLFLVVEDIVNALAASIAVVRSPTAQADMTALATRLYDDLVVPIDWPMRDGVERVMEGYVRGMIPLFVEYVLRQLDMG